MCDEVAQTAELIWTSGFNGWYISQGSAIGAKIAQYANLLAGTRLFAFYFICCLSIKDPHIWL